eukprot:UN09259
MKNYMNNCGRLNKVVTLTIVEVEKDCFMIQI